MSFRSKKRTGKQGERLFREWADRNYFGYKDVSEDSRYYDDDIDFFCYTE